MSRQKDDYPRGTRASTGSHELFTNLIKEIMAVIGPSFGNEDNKLRHCSENCPRCLLHVLKHRNSEVSEKNKYAFQ